MKNNGGGEIPIEQKLKLSRNYLKTIVKYMKENNVRVYDYDGIRVELSDSQIVTNLPRGASEKIDLGSGLAKVKEAKKFIDFEEEQDKFYNTEKWNK